MCILFTSGLQTYCDSISTEQWEFAFNIAMQCLSKFQESANRVEDIEKKSCEAIALLTERYVYNCHVVLHHPRSYFVMVF